MDLLEVPSAPFARHPWEVSRAAFFRRVLADEGLLSSPAAVLDVGAGDGYLARGLLAAMPPASSVTCFDVNYSDADLRAFAEPPVAGLAFTRERPARRFEVLLLLDVIEHVPDDAAFLRGVLDEHLAPGGAVLVSVPAWPALFSRHDEALKHYRRYTPAACRALLAGAGLTVVRGGGVFHSLLGPRAAAVAGERVQGLLRRRPPAASANLGQWRGGVLLTRAIAGALALDNALSLWTSRARLALPGLSTWALCRRAAA